MKPSCNHPVRDAVRAGLSRACLGLAAVAALPAAALAGVSAETALKQQVYHFNAHYDNVNVALHKEKGWVVGTPCVSGPQSGAMGFHLVNPSRLADGILDPQFPEALIYEPLADGLFRLVGVEFIQDAADWAARYPNGPAPSVNGNLMNYVGEPNRYGLHAFYELHVWAFEDNPMGAFADWNTRVTCENAINPPK